MQFEEGEGPKEGNQHKQKHDSFSVFDQKQQIGRNSLQHQDESKIKEYINLHSSLENKEQTASKEHLHDKGTTLYEDDQNGGIAQNILMRIQARVNRKIFEVNYVLLKNNVVNQNFLYQCILLLELLQVLFFVFTKVNIIDEYSNYETSGLQPSISGNYGSSNTTLPSDNNNEDTNEGGSANFNTITQSNIANIQQPIVPFLDYIKFANFHLYSFGQEDGSHRYIVIYSILFYFFYLLVTLLMVFSEKLFKAQTSGNIKDGTKLIIKVLSLLVFAFLSIFQIPFQQVLLQGFHCDEDMGTTDFAVTGIECKSLSNLLLIVLSSVTLIMYSFFLYIQSKLYFSSNYLDQQSRPTSRFDSNSTEQLRIVIRFIISATFIFGKNSPPYIISIVHLFCAILFINNLANRVMGISVNYVKSIQRAKIMKDSILIVMYIIVPLEQLNDDNSMEISVLLTLLLIGVAIGILLIMVYERREQAVLKEGYFPKTLQTLRTYLQILYQSLQKQSSLQSGLLLNHIDKCDSQNCQCQEILHLLYSKRELNITKIKNEGKQFRTPENYLPKIVEQTQSTGIGGGPTPNITGGVISDSSSYYSRSLVGLDNEQSLKEILSSSRQAPDLNKNHSNQDSKSDSDHSNDYDISHRLLSIEQQQFCATLLFTSELNEALLRYPNRFEFRLLNSWLHQSKHQNFIKALFEQMACSHMEQSYHQKFMMFMNMNEIQEQCQSARIRQSNNQNKVSENEVDMQQVLEFQRAIERFRVNEYLAVCASLRFWRELQNKEVNSTILLFKGMQITRYYHRVQDAALQVEKIYPEDIKFQCKYGKFLLYIMNNQYEGQLYLKKASDTYQNKLSRKDSWQNSSQSDLNYGENSNCAVLVCELQKNRSSMIIHTNDEILHHLGYQRSEVINLNIECIQPALIAFAHAGLVQRYLETGKSKMLNTLNETFALSKEGYLVPIHLLMKIQLSSDGRILFVGLLNKLSKYKALLPINEEHQKFEQHYIVTDTQGYIANISEGLKNAMGLHPTLFKYNIDNRLGLLTIQQLCPDIYEDISRLENEGQVLTFNTEKTLDYIDIEQLQQDDIEQLRERAGDHKVFIQMKRITLGEDDNCTMILYGIIMFSDIEISESNLRSDFAISQKAISQDIRFDMNLNHSNSDQNQDQISNESAAGKNYISDAASLSSSTSSSISFDSVIRNFKQQLNEKRTPNKLLKINIFILMAVLLIMLLSIGEFVLLRNEVDNIKDENTYNLKSQTRGVLQTQIASNVQSLINIANELESDVYFIPEVARFTGRFEYLQRLLVEQEGNLHEIQESINQRRDTNLSQQFEYQPITVFRLDTSNEVSLFTLPYRVAMMSYLGLISAFNGTKRDNLKLPQELIRFEPDQAMKGSKSINVNTTQWQKDAFFLTSNGLRGIRRYTQSALTNQRNSLLTNNAQSPFFIILIVAVTLLCFATGLIIYQIWQIERIKLDIVMLYSILQYEQIAVEHLRCNDFFRSLNQQTFQITSNIERSEDQQEYRIRVRQESTMKEKLSINKSTDKKQSYKTIPKSKTVNGKQLYSNIIKKAQQDFQKLESYQVQQDVNPIYQGQKVSIEERKVKKKLKKSFGIKSGKNKNKKKLSAFKEKEIQLEEEKESDYTNQSDEEKQPKQISKKNKSERIFNSEENKQFQESDNAHLRQRQFKQTFKSTRLTKHIIAIVIISLAFCSQYIQLHLFNEDFQDQLLDLQTSIPIVLDRFRNLIMTQAMLRDRIVFNNSLRSYDNRAGYGYSNDNFFYDRTLATEASIKRFKTGHPSISNNIAEKVIQQDSSRFCEQYINQTSNAAVNDLKQQRFNKRKYRQDEVQQYSRSVGQRTPLIKAVYYGDIKSLIGMKSNGIDMNQVDYDQTSMLHFAVKGKQKDVVNLLISYNVTVNLVDRFNSTPIDYAVNGSEIYEALSKAGGKRRTTPIYKVKTNGTVKMTDNEYRMFYAASSGLVNAAEYYFQEGTNPMPVDIEGRTPLHIAASTGQLITVKFLLSKGADIFTQDSRGLYPSDYASSVGRESVNSYLDSLIIDRKLKELCPTLFNGLLNQGFNQAIGQFLKKFIDIQIEVNATNDYNQRLDILRGPTDPSMLQVYFNVQELVIPRIFDVIINTMLVTLENFSDLYLNQTLAIFISYLILYVLTIFIFRGNMINRIRCEIIESRGILNLVPNQIFENNKSQVENIIKKFQQ